MMDIDTSIVKLEVIGYRDLVSGDRVTIRGYYDEPNEYATVIGFIDEANDMSLVAIKKDDGKETQCYRWVLMAHPRRS